MDIATGFISIFTRLGACPGTVALLTVLGIVLVVGQSLSASSPRQLEQTHAARICDLESLSKRYGQNGRNSIHEAPV